jgi:hypothetical protein
MLGTKSIQPKAGERVRDVRCTDDSLEVDIADGRTIIVPLAWYPRLLHGTEKERANWRASGAGFGIHWPDLDEDLSVEGLLDGRPSGESQQSFKEWLDRRTERRTQSRV